MKKIKKISIWIMVFVMLFQIMPMKIYALESNKLSVDANVYDINIVRDEFKTVFPEYKERIEECDRIAQNAQSEVLLSNETEYVVESITRNVDDGIYTLTFYSDGGYSEVAFRSVDTYISFSNGTDCGTYYENCIVTTYMSDPGIITYTGGMIGDSIAFLNGGNFAILNLETI